MNNIEMNKQMIVEAVNDWLANKGKFDIYSDETKERIECLSKRIDKHPCLDSATKADLDNELRFTVDVAASEAIEAGIHIGISLLENLLNGEQPEIRIGSSEIKKERYTLTFPPMPEFCDYVANMSKYLSREDKLKLMGRIDTIIERHREETNSIF